MRDGLRAILRNSNVGRSIMKTESYRFEFLGPISTYGYVVCRGASLLLAGVWILGLLLSVTVDPEETHEGGHLHLSNWVVWFTWALGSVGLLSGLAALMFNHRPHVTFCWVLLLTAFVVIVIFSIA